MHIQEYHIDGTPMPPMTKRSSLLQEMTAVFQPIRLLSQYKTLTRSRTGNGQRVMLIPGWKSHETVMYPMKSYLEKLGYQVEYWGLGFNQGQVEKYRDQLIERINHENEEGPITLIGWSLGGIVAREVARSLPSKIAGVVTYGTPAIGGPKYTIGAKAWGEAEADRITKLSEELDATNPITVPMSIIFTKKDSIVNWSACIDHNSANAKHYEVKSTHLSLGIDPEVWKIVSMHLSKYS